MSSIKSKSSLILVLACICTQVNVSNGNPKVSSVNASEQLMLPATEVQMKKLAKHVCMELYGYKDKLKIKACTESFLHRSPEVSNKSEEPLQILCQSQQKVAFKTTPSTQTKLVILLSKNRNMLINFKLLTNSKSTDFIPITSQGNYSLWMTTLDPGGAPTAWIRGPDVSPMEDDTKDYDVNVEYPMFEYRNKTNDIEATFGVNFYGVPNACAEVRITNICDKLNGGLFYYKKIKLENQTVTIKGLTTNDGCVLAVHRGKQQIKLKYQTPWCSKLTGCIPPPEKVKNIYIEATESIVGFGWDILVSWAKPRHLPDKYNVTLRAEEVSSLLLDGNKTEVIFEGVKGQGMYNVSIETIAVNGRAWNTARALFPASAQQASSLAVVVAGAWCGALLAALTAGATVCWLRHRANKLPIYLEATFCVMRNNCVKEGRIVQDEESMPNCSGETTQTTLDDSWEVKSERLLVHEVIGEGAFGVVRRGTLAPGGKNVAIKMLKEFPTVEEVRAFLKEMELMKNVGAHPHVVSLVGCCTGRRPLIVAEYCSRGDLLSFLRCSWDVMVSKRNVKYYNNINNNYQSNNNYRDDLFTTIHDNDPDNNFVVNKMYDLQSVCDAELTSSDLISFCRQIAMGMEFLASNRLVHRDLAARNVLVTADKMLKIADFGLSRDVYAENQYKQKGSGKMPVKWMAPESLTHRIYTTKTDVWSFGVVMWEVTTVGASPYPDIPVARLPSMLKGGYRMPRPSNCSEQLYALMRDCWHPRPKQRPSFAELYQMLDDLLNTACAENYLTLEVDAEDADVPATPKYHRYLKMLFRDNRMWSRGDRERYEQPWKSSRKNRITRPPPFPKTV